MQYLFPTWCYSHRLFLRIKAWSGAVILHQSLRAKLGDRRVCDSSDAELWNGSSRKFEFFAPPGCRWRIEAICHYFAFDIKRGGAARKRNDSARLCMRQRRCSRARGCDGEDIEYWSIMDGANNTLTWCDANFHKAPFDSERTLLVIDQRQENTRHKEKSPLLSEWVCRVHAHALARKKEKVAASADIARSLLAEIVFAEFANSSVRSAIGAT